MSDWWNSRSLVRDWASLIRLCGCVDEEDFESEISTLVHNQADVEELDGHDGITFAIRHRPWDQLYYPFPISEFGRLLREMAIQADHWHAVLGLPEFDQADNDPFDVTPQLAQFFRVSDEDFVHKFGHGWTAFPPDEDLAEGLVEGDDPEPVHRWFARGSVVLAVTPDFASVFTAYSDSDGEPGEVALGEQAAMVELWRADSAERTGRALRLVELVAATALSEDDSGAGPADCSRQLGGFLGVPVDVFTTVAGGGWKRMSFDDLIGDVPGADAWFASGHPVQVLLGVTSGHAIVASPATRPRGLVGPGGVEVRRPQRVALWRPASLVNLSAQIQACAAARRAAFGYCATCRRLVEDGDTPKCRECLTRYDGWVID